MINKEELQYVSLHNHTTGSIGDSILKPKDLIEEAKRLGQTAVAITDHGSFASMWNAYKIAKKAGIKLIAGCEIYFVDDADDEEDTTLRHLVLLAKNSHGYKNVLTINKLGFDKFTIAFKKAIPRVDWKILKEHSEGIICTSACGNGPISQFIMKDDIEGAKNIANKLKDIFGDDFALELQPHNLQRRPSPYSGPINQQKINLALKKIGQELGIRCIVATDAHYLKKEHHRAHDVYLCDSTSQPIASGNRLIYDKHDFYVKSAEDVFQYFERHIKVWGEDFVKSLFDNTIYYANQCEESDFIDPAVVTGEKNQLPEFPVKDEPDYNEFLQWKEDQKANPGPLWKDGLKEDAEFYRYKSGIGLENRIKEGKIPEEDREYCYKQMLEEFNVFEYRGFSSYMLIVADFLNWCRSNDVSVGPGRGCTTKDTLILTEKGYRSISEISGGDKVITHTGALKDVICKFNNGKADDLYSIKTVWSYEPKHFTQDHLVLAQKKSKFHKDKEPKWLPVKDLKKGDYIFSSFPKRLNTIIPEPIDMSQFIKDINYLCNYTVKDNIIEVQDTHYKNPVSIRQISRDSGVCFGSVHKFKNSKKFPEKYRERIEKAITDKDISVEEWKNLKFVRHMKRFIEWDEDFCYLLGRWIGDGSFHGKNRGITIAFNAKDKAGINKIKTICDNLFGKTYINNNHGSKTCVAITVCSEVVNKLFQNIFVDYKSAKSKHLPEEFRNLPDFLLTSLIKGYADADGYVSHNNEKITTISKRLALETKEALLYLKIPTNIFILKEPKRYGVVNNTRYDNFFAGVNRERIDFSKITEEGYYCRLLENPTPIDVQETFDIKVKDDASYLTCNFVAHNSVGGSITAYVNGIHQAYAKKYGLIFERFLNVEKEEFCDIDNDLSPIGREKLKDYLREKYGGNNVANVSNINTITPKVYARDISRIFEFGDGGRSVAAEVGNNIADSIPADIKTVKKALEEAPLFAEYAKQYPELVEFAEILDGMPRAWSTHAGGIVITKTSMENLIPLRKDTSDILAISHDKYEIEELGGVKIDLLGLKTLDIIDQTYDLINRNGMILSKDIFDYELYDEKAYDLIGRGDTFGVFQLDSTAVHVCKKVKPKSIKDIALITAIIRPSSKDAIDDILKVRNGIEIPTYEHEIVEKAFGSTYGKGLFEEQLMILAEQVGWSLREADHLRKLTKLKGKKPELVEKWKNDFITDCQNNIGISKEIAESIWQRVELFQGYGFNRSHAVLYSFISYKCAWLKANYPIEFLTANLISEVKSNARDSTENILKIKNELRERKVKIVPPELNTSELSWKIVDDNTLMAGLDSLKYMGKDAIPEILEKRPFHSFKDLIHRTDSRKLRSPSIQAMAASGSLDYFGMDRKLMFLYASDYRAKLRNHIDKFNRRWLKENLEKWIKDNNIINFLTESGVLYQDSNGNKILPPRPTQEEIDRCVSDFEYPFPKEEPWAIQDLYALEEFYMGEGISGTVFDRYPGFLDKKKSIPFEALKQMFPWERKHEDERLNRKANTHYIGNMKIRPLEAIITSVFSFIVKKEESPIFGQEMARINISDPWGEESTLLCFPEAWADMKDRIEKQLHGGNQKIEPGLAIRFLGQFQWENDHTTSFVLSDILDCRKKPELPEDRKSRKVKMPRTKKVDKKEAEKLDEEELVMELEGEMVENGIVEIPFKD